jgi:hypothetical protein
VQIRQLVSWNEANSSPTRLNELTRVTELDSTQPTLRQHYMSELENLWKARLICSLFGFAVRRLTSRPSFHSEIISHLDHIGHMFAHSKSLSAIWGLHIVLPVLAGDPEISTVSVRDLLIPSCRLKFCFRISLFGLTVFPSLGRLRCWQAARDLLGVITPIKVEMMRAYRVHHYFLFLFCILTNHDMWGLRITSSPCQSNFDTEKRYWRFTLLFVL